MKKTFRFLSMAALLVVGAIMTGCSNDDNIDNPQQPANNDNVVTLTATVSLDGGAQTRAITPSSGAKTFEATNKIAVIYKNTTGSGETVKAESGTLTLSADGTKATFTVTLTNPASNSAVRYIYPATMAKDVAADATITSDDATIDYTGLFGSQNGNLTTLGTNYDLAVFDGSLSGTDLPASASLTNPLAICALTLKDGSSDITSSITSLNVSDGTNTYHVALSSQSPIYVAMKPATGKIAFTAATGSKTYFKTTASAQTLAASTLYNNISVSMVELTVGKIIGADGNIYADADAATTAGTTALAKIAYLGSDAETSTTYNHGLALALSDVSGYQTWCSQTSSTCLTTQYSSEADMAGLANTDALVGHDSHTHAAASAARNYNSGTHPTGTSAWFLPSAGQWDKMSGYNNLGLQSDRYWSSSEYDAYDAWVFRSNNGDWRGYSKDEAYIVRACLAF